MAQPQPGKGLEYKVILSHVTDFEDWVSSGSGDDYEETLRIPFQKKAANNGIDDPHASFFGKYEVRDPATGIITTIPGHDDFGLLNQPYHYQDEVHPYIYDKKARGGSAQRDLEFELDVNSITHNWSGLGSALNMPARNPFSRGDDNDDSITNSDVGGMVYQLNALAMDLGSQSETITVQGTCIDRENPPHQDSPGAPHIRKQQLLDIARGQWAGSSGFTFEGDNKDLMTPSYWLALTIGPVRGRTLQSAMFVPLKTSLASVLTNNSIAIDQDSSASQIIIQLSDNTALTVDDIIEIDAEQFEIDALGSPFSSNNNTTLVTRARNSTAAAYHSSGTKVKVYPYTEKYWTGDEPSDDIRGKERLRNEYQPGAVSPNTEQGQTISGTDYRVLSSGYKSTGLAANGPLGADHPEIKQRKAATFEHNRYPAETEFWRDGWRRKTGSRYWGFLGKSDAQPNNPLLRDWDYKFHYDGRSRYRGAIKNITFTQQGGSPDVWDFNLQFMVVKNETQIRHLSTADDHDSDRAGG